MNIVLWGTYDTSKPRIRILRDGLRANGIGVLEIHTSIWEDVNDKSSLHGIRMWLGRGLRLLAAYPPLVWRYLRASKHDLVLVSYPGQIDVIVLRPFTWLRRKPLAFDWFISAYDTVVCDRKLVGRYNPLALVLWMGEWLTARAANLAFMDTATHARRMERLFRLAQGTLDHVWVGAEAIFFQHDAKQQIQREKALNVLFYGQFIPLHGIATIIEAAGLARNAPVYWTLIGRGQEAARIRAALDADPLPKVRWIEWVSYDTLPDWIAGADVCLGVFGTSQKAASVIPNKVFQIVANGRPLITSDSKAIHELLTNDPPCVSLVRSGDAKSLADAVQSLLGNSHTLARVACHAAQWRKVSPVAIGRQFLSIVAKYTPESKASHEQ